MSTVTQVGVGVAAANSAFPLPFTPISGRSLIITVNHEAVLNGINGFSNNNTAQTWVDEDPSISVDPGGLGRRVYRCQSLTGTMPTTVTCSSSTAGTIHYVVTEVTGLHATPFVGIQYKNEASNRTSHSETFTSSNNNDLAVVLVTGNADQGTITPSSGFTEIADSRNARSAFYKADLGTAGTQTLAYTSSAIGTQNHLIAVYKSAVTDPTVSTISNPTATEGSPLAFLITLSGATTRSTDYVFTLTGTATSADYTSTLTTAMCDNSVTVSGATGSGGTFTVPSGVSSFTVTVPTTSDTTDEDNETIVLTVGGTASTGGLITDDDAPPVVTFTDGVESFGVVTCTATLDAVSGKDVTFDVSTANGSKTAGTHYTALSAVPVTILAGNLTATITVNTL